jgi:hypothetical protein
VTDRCMHGLPIRTCARCSNQRGSSAAASRRERRWVDERSQQRGSQPHSARDVDQIIALLTDPANRVSASSWLQSHPIDGPGLYTWWTDVDGAADLTEGLGEPITAGLIYAGQTGGTTVGGVVRTATLRSRVGGSHLRGRIRGSTFRFTLGCALLRPLQLVAIAPKQLTPESEATLSNWMRRHLSVCTVLVADRATVMQLEHDVLARLNPPLNLEGMAASTLRGQISRLRRQLGRK